MFKVYNNSERRQWVLQDEHGRTEEKFFPHKECKVDGPSGVSCKSGQINC